MRVMKTDNAVDVWPDAALKNFIFYIFSMYEFSHSLGHKRTNHRRPKSTFVRFAPDNGHRRRAASRCSIILAGLAVASSGFPIAHSPDP
jgi:hypothetical protein